MQEIEGGQSLRVGQDVEFDDEPIRDGEGEHRDHAAVDRADDAGAAIDRGEARLEAACPVPRRRDAATRGRRVIVSGPGLFRCTVPDLVSDLRRVVVYLDHLLVDA